MILCSLDTTRQAEVVCPKRFPPRQFALLNPLRIRMLLNRRCTGHGARLAPKSGTRTRSTALSRIAPLRLRRDIMILLGERNCLCAATVRFGRSIPPGVRRRESNPIRGKLGIRSGSLSTAAGSAGRSEKLSHEDLEESTNRRWARSWCSASSWPLRCTRARKTGDGADREGTKANLASVVSASGEIKPKTYVNIGANAFGRIIKLHVKEGDRVKKGQLLAQLENVQSSADVNATRASVQAAANRCRRADAALKTVARRPEPRQVRRRPRQARLGPRAGAVQRCAHRQAGLRRQESGMGVCRCRISPSRS
jgi:biotin carboxyl carrier protein